MLLRTQGEGEELDPVLNQIPLKDIVEGEDYEGVINNVVSYGAFVDIGSEVCVGDAVLLHLPYGCPRVSGVSAPSVLPTVSALMGT